MKQIEIHTVSKLLINKVFVINELDPFYFYFNTFVNPQNIELKLF